MAAARVHVIIPHAGGHLASLAHRIDQAQTGGRKVVLATANRPAAEIKDLFEEHGVDVENLRIVDCVSSAGGVPPVAQNRGTIFVQSPTMLELIAMRSEQAASAQSPAHVIVDNLNALALYNGQAPVIEFCHYLANRLQALGAVLDFVVLPNEQGAELEEKIKLFAGTRLDLEI